MNNCRVGKKIKTVKRKMDNWRGWRENLDFGQDKLEKQLRNWDDKSHNFRTFNRKIWLNWRDKLMG